MALWLLVPFIALSIAWAIFRKKPAMATVFNIYAFAVVVTWITLVVGVLINLMELIQLLTNINSVFLGLTILAGAASIGDYMSITAFAKKGYACTAVSGIFSGQLLNFLIGFGIALIVNSISG
jgi:Ca2+/Na+ antiporter